MSSKIQIIITIDHPARADQGVLQELKNRFSSLSRARIKTWFQEKRVFLGSRPLQASTLLPAGRHELQIQGISEEDISQDPTQLPAQPSSQGCFLPIIYESESLLVLNKAAGIPSVPHSPQETETAVGAALAHHPALASIGTRSLEPAILHRLDTGTSGLLAFAQTQDEYLRLRKLWSSGEVKKTYRAQVAPTSETSELPSLPSELRISMAHDARSSKRMIALTEGKKQHFRGNPLSTITRILSATFLNNHYDLEIEIQTGVMHQIRCTVASLGFPILGDLIYRGQPSSRLWLHAWKLEIPTREGGRLKLEAPLPPDWNHWQQT